MCGAIWKDTASAWLAGRPFLLDPHLITDSLSFPFLLLSHRCCCRRRRRFRRCRRRRRRRCPRRRTSSRERGVLPRMRSDETALSHRFIHKARRQASIPTSAMISPRAAFGERWSAYSR